MFGDSLVLRPLGINFNLAFFIDRHHTKIPIRCISVSLLFFTFFDEAALVAMDVPVRLVCLLAVAAIMGVALVCLIGCNLANDVPSNSTESVQMEVDMPDLSLLARADGHYHEITGLFMVRGLSSSDQQSLVSVDGSGLVLTWDSEFTHAFELMRTNLKTQVLSAFAPGRLLAAR